MATADRTSHVESPPTSPSVRIWRGLGVTLLWLGGLTLGFVAHQLFVTTWIAQWQQSDVDQRLEARFATAVVTTAEYEPVEATGSVATPDEPDDVGSGPSGSPASDDAAARLLLVESPPAAHEPFARIRIPVIERLVDGWTVVEGVRRDDLRNGAGHMPWTPLPGQPGNAVISGHRTTYGAPFHELDILRAGDRIEVDTALGTHVYEVRDSFVVRPTDVWVTEPRPGAWLTLTTCNPRFSARERLVVQAELIDGPNAAVIGGTA